MLSVKNVKCLKNALFAFKMFKWKMDAKLIYRGNYFSN